MSASEIAEHNKLFEEGVSCLKLKSDIEPYPNIGLDDGLFVLPKSEMDALLAKTGGDIELIEKELGIPNNKWKNAINNNEPPTKLVRINIKNPVNLRMPTGNETNAFENLWLPGGKTPAGWNEAVINFIPKTNESMYELIENITK